MRRLLAAVVLVGAACAAGCAGKSSPGLDPKAEGTQKARMATSFLNAGRVNEAIELIEQAIALSPEDAAMHSFHGQVLLIAGRLPAAEAALKKALALDPNLTDAHNNLGAVYDKLGRKSEAEQEFLKALADPAYPTPERAHFNLGLLYSSQGRADEAIRELRRAVEIQPKYYPAHYELAGLLERQGSADEAARLYEVAAPQYKGQGEYHYKLGVVYLRLKETEKARLNLQKVIEVSPGSENAAKADELLKMIR